MKNFLLVILCMPVLVFGQVLENIALNGTATASTTSTNSAGWVAWKAVDGDLTTRWLDNDGANPDNIEVVFDNGPHVIESYAFWMDDGFAVTAYTAELYNGETLVATDEVTSPVATPELAIYHKYSGSFSSVSATKIILTITSSDGRERLHELEVYAYSNDAPSDVTAVFNTDDVNNPYVDINWTDNTNDELGFTVSRTGGAGNVSFTVDAGVTSYQDYDVEYFTSYSYTVTVNLPGDESASGTAVTVDPEGFPLNVSYQSTLVDFSSQRNTTTQRAANVSDGLFDNSHRWLTADDADLPHYVTLELPEASTIASYFIYMNPNIWATAFSIDYSTDGTNFSEAIAVDSAEVSFLQKDGLNLSLISGNLDAPVENVTHIRLNITGVLGYDPEAELDLSTNDPRMRIHEFEMYAEPLPEQPTNVMISEDVSDMENPTITLNWDDNQDNETGFAIYNGITKVVDLDPDVTSYTMDLIYGVNYEIKVSVANAVGETFSESLHYAKKDLLNNIISTQKTAVSSSNYDMTRDEDEAVDGDRNSIETTRWMTTNQNDPLVTPEWIEIDLGASYTISGYRLSLENHPSGMPTAWEFQYDDNGSWVSADTTAITEIPDSSALFYDLTSGVEIYEFTLGTESVTTSKVRWYVSASPALIRLYELEVFGSFSPDKTWDGTTWSPSAPEANDQVLIAGDYHTTTDGNLTELGPVQIADGFTLTIGDGGLVECLEQLENTGTVEILSGGSLLTQGDIFGDHFIIHRSTSATGEQRSLVGSMISDGLVADLGSEVYIYDESIKYDEGVTDGAERFVAENVGASSASGKGYVSVGAGGLTFTGMPNNGDVVIQGTKTVNDEPAYEGLNLVANPYPSAISVDSFLTVNAANSGTLWFWDDAGVTNNDDYVTVNQLGVVFPSEEGSFDGFIRSGQGFFLKVDSTVNVRFNNNMRVSGNNDDAGFMRTAQSAPSAFKINVSDADSFNETLIGFNANATEGVDKGMDAVKLSTAALQAFTYINEDKYAIQGLPEITDEVTIGLGVAASEAGTYQIAMSDLEGLPEGYMVFLEDTVANEIVSLMDEGMYDVAIAAGSTAHFNIRLSTTDLTEEEEEVLANDSVKKNILRVTKNALYIELGDSESGTVEVGVFNVAGKRLLTGSFTDSNEMMIPFEFNYNTIYLITLGTKNGMETQKVMLKE